MLTTIDGPWLTDKGMYEVNGSVDISSEEQRDLENVITTH